MKPSKHSILSLKNVNFVVFLDIFDVFFGQIDGLVVASSERSVKVDSYRLFWLL